MEKKKAREIIKNNSLISRNLSKKLLSSILNNYEYKTEWKPFINNVSYNNLRNEFIKQKEKIKQKDGKVIPRYLPFYHIIKNKYPEFDWKVDKKSISSSDNTNVILYRPKVKGIEVTLGSLLLEYVDKVEKEYSDNEKAIKSLIDKVNFASNTEKVSKTLLMFINSLKKKEINIISPICPDYANIDIGKGLYRFTFDNLGSDIGVTAKRLLANLSQIHSFFEKLNIKFKHFAPIGDFEALSKDTLRRVNLNFEQFKQRLETSQFRLSEQAGHKIHTPFFSDFCEGLENWSKIHLKFLEMINNNDYGFSGLTKNDIEIIIESRKPLLYRWFGKISDKKILKVLKFQGAEYATMGYIIEKEFKNPIIIGTDHFRMAPFYNVHSKVPVLYLTSNYMTN